MYRYVYLYLNMHIFIFFHVYTQAFFFETIFSVLVTFRTPLELRAVLRESPKALAKPMMAYDAARQTAPEVQFACKKWGDG